MPEGPINQEPPAIIGARIVKAICECVPPDVLSRPITNSYGSVSCYQLAAIALEICPASVSRIVPELQPDRIVYYIKSFVRAARRKLRVGPFELSDLSDVCNLAEKYIRVKEEERSIEWLFRAKDIEPWIGRNSKLLS